MITPLIIIKPTNRDQTKMAGEGDKHIAPDTARYYPIDFKKAVPIVLAIMLMGLLLLVFFTGTDSDEREQAVEEIEAEQPVRTTSTEEFDQQLGRRLSDNETNRIEEEAEIPRPRVKLPNYQDRREAVISSLRGRTEGAGGSSVLAEFRAKELERALSSGVNGFGTDESVLGDALSQGVGSGQSVLPDISARQAGAQGGIDNASARVNEALQNLQNLQNRVNAGGANGATPPPGGAGGFGGAFATPAPAPAIAQNTRSSSGDTSGNTGTRDNPAFPAGFAGSNATFLATAPAGTKTIIAGTVIPIVLETKVISDYTGQVKARILRDVYSNDNTSVLIPAGSVVLARSAQLNTEQNEAINNRVAIAAPTIIRPDGLKIDLRDQNLLDAAGVGGIKDKTNYHILTQALAAVAFVGVTALGTSEFVDLLDLDDDDQPLVDNSGEDEPIVTTPTVQIVTTTDTTTVTTVDADGNETTTTTTTTDEEPVVLTPTVNLPNGDTVSVTSFDTGDNIEAQIAGQFGVQLQTIFQPIISRFFNLEPTITLRPGTRMTLILEKDVYAAPWSNLYDEFN